MREQLRLVSLHGWLDSFRDERALARRRWRFFIAAFSSAHLALCAAVICLRAAAESVRWPHIRTTFARVPALLEFGTFRLWGRCDPRPR
jgi:hypothetical protein